MALSLTGPCTLISGEPHLVESDDIVRGLELAVRLVLTPTSLTVQESIAVWDSSIAATADTNQFDRSGLSLVRELSLCRNHRGSFGFSIRGGSECGLPILVSRLQLGDRAGDGSGEGKKRSPPLFVGDAILRIDQACVDGASHTEAVARLRNAGQQVTLLVKHYRQAARLLLSYNRRSAQANSSTEQSDIPASSTTSTKISWANLMTVPLLFARLRRHAAGTDKPRPPDCLEVVALSGHSTGCLRFQSTTNSGDYSAEQWHAAIRANIRQLSDAQAARLNAHSIAQHSGSSMPVHYTGWFGLTLHESPLRSRLWQDVFLALRGEDLLLFELPPVLADDWLSYSLKEKLYKCVIRVLPPREQLDRRDNAFFLHAGGGGEAFYMSAASGDDLERLERCWFRATAEALTSRARRGAPVVFKVTCEEVSGTLTFDLNNGVQFNSDLSRKTATFVDSVSTRPGRRQLSWSHSFSNLRRTSDDRDQTLYLYFSESPLSAAHLAPTTVRVVQTPDLQLLLIVLHAFLSSKLAAVDPAFSARLAASQTEPPRQ